MANSGVLAIGVDIGGTDTKLGLVDSHGAIRQFQHFPSNTVGDPPPFLREMVERIGQLRDLGRDQVCGVGLSVHGYVDAERRGPIVAPNTPGLCGLDLRSMLEDAFGLPVVVNADLTAHVLAEYHYGSGRGSRRFLCLAVGTGLGAGWSSTVRRCAIWAAAPVIPAM